LCPACINFLQCVCVLCPFSFCCQSSTSLGELLPFLIRLHNFGSITSVAKNITVIKIAGGSFSEYPSKTATQAMLPLQINDIAMIQVVAKAACRAHQWPWFIKEPKRIETPPKIAPKMRAVFAFLGFIRKPMTPTSSKKKP